MVILSVIHPLVEPRILGFLSFIRSLSQESLDFQHSSARWAKNPWILFIHPLVGISILGFSAFIA